MSEDGERIARLEQQAGDTRTDHDQLVEKVDAIAADINAIKEKLSNWRGFVSGMVFAVSALAGLIGAGATWLWHRFGQ
jgi:uncharacterized protein YoxC